MNRVLYVDDDWRTAIFGFLFLLFGGGKKRETGRLCPIVGEEKRVE